MSFNHVKVTKCVFYSIKSRQCLHRRGQLWESICTCLGLCILFFYFLFLLISYYASLATHLRHSCGILVVSRSCDDFQSHLVSLLQNHAPNWKNLVSVLFSLFASLILAFFIEFFFSFDSHGLVTIHSEYYIKEKTIVFQRGSLLDAFDEYHELVNPFVMKKEIQKKVYID